jgi:hypothetical protein
MTGDSKRRGRRLLGAAVLILTIGIVGLVCLNAVLLGQLVEEVSTAQHRMAALTESGREILVLEQRIVELGTRSAPEKVVVQQGLLDRQLVVSIAALPPDSAPAHELTAVQLALNGYDWDRLAATGGRDEALRLSAIDLASAAEHTVNGLRNDAEQ